MSGKQLYLLSNIVSYKSFGVSEHPHNRCVATSWTSHIISCLLSLVVPFIPFVACSLSSVQSANACTFHPSVLCIVKGSIAPLQWALKFFFERLNVERPCRSGRADGTHVARNGCPGTRIPPTPPAQVGRRSSGKA